MSSIGAPTALPKTLGAWIAALRTSRYKQGRGAIRPWARADLAKRASISEVTLYHIETEAELPRFEVLDAIVRALDVPEWEGQMLRDMWIARAARAVVPPVLSGESRAEILRVFNAIPYPAVILDELYYFKAANRYFLYTSPVQVADTVDEEPSGMLGPRPLAMPGVRPIVVGRSLRRFLLHTAPWSRLPGYPPLLERLDARLASIDDWWGALHAEDITAGRESRLQVAGVGAVNFLAFDLYQDAGRSHLIRVLTPTKTSFAKYAKVKALAEATRRAGYLAPTWKSPA